MSNKDGRPAPSCHATQEGTEKQTPGADTRAIMGNKTVEEVFKPGEYMQSMALGFMGCM